MMSDCLQLTMMFPFILNRFLKNTHFKNPELALFQHRTEVTRSDLTTKVWLKCWVVMAKTMAMVFKDSFTEEEYDELRECLHNERRLLSQVLLFKLYISYQVVYVTNRTKKLSIYSKFHWCILFIYSFTMIYFINILLYGIYK
jgi:hypothetical protein